MNLGHINIGASASASGKEAARELASRLLMAATPANHRCKHCEVLMKTARALVACCFPCLCFSTFSAAAESRSAEGAPLPLGFSVKLEPGAAIPIDGPQSRDFGAGAGGMLKAALGLGRVLDLQLSGIYLGFPDARVGTPGFSGAGGGARVLWPRDQSWIAPWADGDLLYVRTGDLDRFSFAAAVGVHVAVEPSRRIWLGAFARYVHVVQPTTLGFDNTAGKFLFLGISAEAGNSPLPDRDHDNVPDLRDRCPELRGSPENAGCPIKEAGGPKDSDGDAVLDDVDNCPAQAGPAALFGCPDSDGDGLVPPEDQCPEKAGEKGNHGCPVYKTIKVTKERIELGQKIFFAFGLATILPRSFPLLEEVALALKDYPSLRIRIEGHTDNVGSSAENLALSEARAAAVRAYLIEHQIAPDRTTSKGYGDTLPRETNSTPEGREQNRRVELVVIGGTTSTTHGHKPE